MELDYHAIYVGTIFEDSLEMQSEFSEKKKEISGYDIVKSDATVSATIWICSEKSNKSSQMQL